jgi:hypothetical protein
MDVRSGSHGVLQVASQAKTSINASCIPETDTETSEISKHMNGILNA